MNLYLAQHALTMLALCYLPGCLAGYIQLFRGTKYSRFPKFLDRWLKMRKQLGLLMLLSASLHVILLFFLFLNLLFYLSYQNKSLIFYHFQIQACMSVGMLEHFTDWDDKWQGQSFFTAGNTFKN